MGASQYDDTIRYLHHLGWTRTEIAEFLGLPRNPVSDRCLAMGLPAHPQTQIYRYVHQHDDQIRQLHSEGLTQQEIADKLFFSRTTIQTREKAMGLTRSAYNHGPVGDRYDGQIRDFYDMGYSQREIAKRVGIDRETVRTRMRKMHLKTKRIFGNSNLLSHEEMDRTVFLYRNCGLSQREVGKTLGIGLSTVQNRLKQAGIQARPQGINQHTKIEKVPVHTHESRTTWASEDAMRLVKTPT